jgi:hypothetical protein
MQEHDLVFRACTNVYNIILVLLVWLRVASCPIRLAPKEDKLSIEKDKTVSAAVRLPNFSQAFISRPQDSMFREECYGLFVPTIST